MKASFFEADLVSPSFMAFIAACLILSGVSKSGSPAPSPITSFPAAFKFLRLHIDCYRQRRFNVIYSIRNHFVKLNYL